MQGTDICQLMSLLLRNSVLKVLCLLGVVLEIKWGCFLNLYCGLCLELLFDFTVTLHIDAYFSTAIKICTFLNL